jgi:hypothetical protein
VYGDSCLEPILRPAIDVAGSVVFKVEKYLFFKTVEAVLNIFFNSGVVTRDRRIESRSQPNDF